MKCKFEFLGFCHLYKGTCEHNEYCKKQKDKAANDNV